MRSAATAKLASQIDDLYRQRIQQALELQNTDNALAKLKREYNSRSIFSLLPVEVIHMIFEYGAAEMFTENLEGAFRGKWYDRPTTGDEAMFKERRFEIVVSHVCKRWRDIALSSPSLWTRIFYRHDQEGSKSLPLECLDVYFERSGTQKLELFFDIISRMDAKMLKLAIKHIARWKVACIHAFIDLGATHFLSSLEQARAPNLEHFVFATYNREPIPLDDLIIGSDLQPTVCSGGTPKLKYVRLDGSMGNILPPLTNVTTLRLESPKNNRKLVYSWSTMSAILSIPSLTNLSILGRMFRAPGEFHRLPISMESLKHLRLCNNNNMSKLLPYLRAPLLETLTLKSSQIHANQPPQDSHFFPSLHTMSLIECKSPPLDAARFLMQVTHHVRNILLDQHPDYGKTIFHVLQREQINWPHLDTLITVYAGNTEMETMTRVACSLPKRPVKLRLAERIKFDWKEKMPKQYSALEEVCIIDTLSEAKDISLLAPVCPPGYYPRYFNNADPFTIHLP